MNQVDKKNSSEIIEQQLPYIRKICASFSEDQEELNDLVQEVCIQLWRTLDSFKGQSKITTWIYRVTVNICLYHVGKRKKHRNVPTDQHLLVNSVESGQEQEQDVDLTKILYDAIKLLKPVDRAIITLYLEKKTHEEISDILGMTPTNVGVRISRCKKELKKIVDERYRTNME